MFESLFLTFARCEGARERKKRWRSFSGQDDKTVCYTAPSDASVVVRGSDDATVHFLGSIPCSSTDHTLALALAQVNVHYLSVIKYVAALPPTK